MVICFSFNFFLFSSFFPHHHFSLLNFSNHLSFPKKMTQSIYKPQLVNTLPFYCIYLFNSKPHVLKIVTELSVTKPELWLRPAFKSIWEADLQYVTLLCHNAQQFLSCFIFHKSHCFSLNYLHQLFPVFHLFPLNYCHCTFIKMYCAHYFACFSNSSIKWF